MSQYYDVLVNQRLYYGFRIRFAGYQFLDGPEGDFNTHHAHQRFAQYCKEAALMEHHFGQLARRILGSFHPWPLRLFVCA